MGGCQSPLSFKRIRAEDINERGGLNLSFFLEQAKQEEDYTMDKLQLGNTKGGSIIVPLTSCLTALELAV